MVLCREESSGDHEEVCSSGDHEEVCSSGDHEEVRSSGDHEEVCSSGDHEEVCSSDDHEEVCSSDDRDMGQLEPRPLHITSRKEEEVCFVGAICYSSVFHFAI